MGTTEFILNVKIQWEAGKMIFKYLKGIAYYSFSYRGTYLELNGYIDVDWTGNLGHFKSTHVYVNGGVISWESKK